MEVSQVNLFQNIVVSALDSSDYENIQDLIFQSFLVGSTYQRLKMDENDLRVLISELQTLTSICRELNKQSNLSQTYQMLLLGQETDPVEYIQNIVKDTLLKEENLSKKQVSHSEAEQISSLFVEKKEQKIKAEESFQKRMNDKEGQILDKNQEDVQQNSFDIHDVLKADLVEVFDTRIKLEGVELNQEVKDIQEEMKKIVVKEDNQDLEIEEPEEKKDNFIERQDGQIQNEEVVVVGQILDKYQEDVQQNSFDIQFFHDELKADQVEVFDTRVKEERVEDIQEEMKEIVVKEDNQDLEIEEPEEKKDNFIERQDGQIQNEEVVFSLKQNNEQWNCEICFEMMEGVEIWPLECNHVFHKQCLEEYFKTQIQSKNLPIKCPNFECYFETAYLDIKDILQKEDFLKFEQFSLNQYIYNNLDEITCCPTPDYLNAFILDAGQTTFNCTSCKILYCLTCRSLFHKGQTCKEYQISNNYNESDRQFENLVKGQKFKQCSKCKMWVEKNQGCDHMTCRCSYQFCYLCGGPYPRCDCRDKQQNIFQGNIFNRPQPNQFIHLSQNNNNFDEENNQIDDNHNNFDDDNDQFDEDGDNNNVNLFLPLPYQGSQREAQQNILSQYTERLISSQQIVLPQQERQLTNVSNNQREQQFNQQNPSSNQQNHSYNPFNLPKTLVNAQKTSIKTTIQKHRKNPSLVTNKPSERNNNQKQPVIIFEQNKQDQQSNLSNNNYSSSHLFLEIYLTSLYLKTNEITLVPILNYKSPLSIIFCDICYLSPIENIWGWLKRKISKDNPTSIRSLKLSVKKHWKSLTPQFLQPFINSMNNRLQQVIQQNGYRINY